MSKPERQRRDSIKGEVMMFEAVEERPYPPLVLNDAEMIYYDKIVTAREMATWSENDLVIACNLAKNMRRLDEVNAALDEHGYTQLDNTGALKARPEMAILVQISNRIEASLKTLGLSAGQRGVSGTKQAKRNQAEQDTRRLAEKARADSLLA